MVCLLEAEVLLLPLRLMVCVCVCVCYHCLDSRWGSSRSSESSFLLYLGLPQQQEVLEVLEVLEVCRSLQVEVTGCVRLNQNRETETGSEEDQTEDTKPVKAGFRLMDSSLISTNEMSVYF